MRVSGRKEHHSPLLFLSSLPFQIQREGEGTEVVDIVLPGSGDTAFGIPSQVSCSSPSWFAALSSHCSGVLLFWKKPFFLHDSSNAVLQPIRFGCDYVTVCKKKMFLQHQEEHQGCSCPGPQTNIKEGNSRSTFGPLKLHFLPKIFFSKHSAQPD